MSKVSEYLNITEVNKRRLFACVLAIVMITAAIVVPVTLIIRHNATVIFHVDGEEYRAKMAGANLMLPGDLLPDGYRVATWYTDEAMTQVFDKTATLPNTLHLYGEKSPMIFIITFDMNTAETGSAIAEDELSFYTTYGSNRDFGEYVSYLSYNLFQNTTQMYNGFKLSSFTLNGEVYASDADNWTTSATTWDIADNATFIAHYTDNSSAAIEEGRLFHENKKTEDGVITTESGLQYKIIQLGEGAVPTSSDTVEVNYEGRFINGEVFDSSYGRESVKFAITGVIDGWQEILQLIPVGTKVEVYIPYHLAYGINGSNSIDGGVSLIFTIDLISIVPPDTTD